jgi:phosphoribosylamine--glycine ligase
MRVLVVGGGGREHALSWTLSKSPLVEELLCAPGNPGMAALGECHPIKAEDVEGITALATGRGVDLVVIGPEAPLVAGLADSLARRDIRVFGPGRRGALLEGSKSYAKSLMQKYGIPTADAKEFESASEALAYVRTLSPPVVVKADGLAAGKGVTVCEDIPQAEEAITDAMERRKFGDAGRKVLIEERLVGGELSVLALCDGKTVLAMEPARDYKRVFDGDRGPNTGGMGSYSPVPDCTPEVLDRVIQEVFARILFGLQKEEVPYVGVIYAGLMLTDEGPKVLEFNSRFGDPETQALVPRLDSDLAEAILACVEGRLDESQLSWREEACISVVVASEGYPGEYRTGFLVDGLDEAASVTGIPVFHAGTAVDHAGRIVTSGGRILNVSALGRDHNSAQQRAYKAISRISFEGMHYRKDVGADAARVAAAPHR